MKKPGYPDLYSPDQPSKHKCSTKGSTRNDCKYCKRVRADCTKCAENKPYELLKTGLKSQIPQHMKDYQGRTGRKMIIGTKKLVGVKESYRNLLVCPGAKVVSQT